MTVAKRITVLLGPKRLARLGYLFIRTIAFTWRIRTVNEPAYRGTIARGRSVVLVLWHGSMLPLLYFHRGRRIAILVSEHGDGEIIAQVAEQFRLSLVRGSTSRGGARALVTLAKKLSDGFDVAMTPDGPRGPAHSIAPGALVAAYRTDAPIVPLAVNVSHAWRLRSWDHFIIPKPFARITIAYGSPALVIANSPREAGGDTEWLRAMMEEAERAARTA